MNYRLISPVISSFVIFSDMYSGLYFQDLQVCVISDVHEIFLFMWTILSATGTTQPKIKKDRHFCFSVCIPEQ